MLSPPFFDFLPCPHIFLYLPFFSAFIIFPWFFLLLSFFTFPNLLYSFHISFLPFISFTLFLFHLDFWVLTLLSRFLQTLFSPPLMYLLMSLFHFLFYSSSLLLFSSPVFSLLFFTTLLCHFLHSYCPFPSLLSFYLSFLLSYMSFPETFFYPLISNPSNSFSFSSLVHSCPISLLFFLAPYLSSHVLLLSLSLSDHFIISVFPFSSSSSYWFTNPPLLSLFSFPLYLSFLFCFSFPLISLVPSFLFPPLLLLSSLLGRRACRGW